MELYASSRVEVAPSDKLQFLSSSLNVCVSSNMVRAKDSAELLGFKRCVAMALFNESELPHPKRLFVPLPWSLFLVIYRLFWFAGCKLNCAGKRQDRDRARAGCQTLIDLAFEHHSVLLVGHGIMNRLLCAELKKLGWSIEQKSGSGYWSSITLSGPAP